MNPTTTLAQLVLSAQAAANTAHTAATAFEQQSAKLQAFTDSGFHAADFATWENAFLAQLTMLETFSKQPTPATTAAKAAPGAPASAPAS